MEQSSTIGLDETQPTWGWLLSAWSIVGMIGVFAWFIGWPMSCLVVAQLCMHELGHVGMLRWQRKQWVPPLFVPPFGALLLIRPFDRARQEALFAAAGPIIGLACSSMLLALSLEMDWMLGIHAAGLGAGINLFNLLPVPPFDGGRILAAAGRIWWGLGVMALGVLLFITPNIIFAMIVAVCAIALIFQLRRPTISGYWEQSSLVQAAAVFSWTILVLWSLVLLAFVSARIA